MDDGIGRLTEAVAAGESWAIETFYRQQFDWLYRQAVWATGRDEAFCLDVVQEAVLRILRTIRRANSPAQLRAWLAIVVRTTALDMLKAEGRRRRREHLAAVGEAGRSDPPDDTDARLDWLRRQIGLLDPHLVRLVELRYTRGWTLARIGSALHLPTSTVNGRLRMALRRLSRQARSEGHV
jgi:RNA polymerase sigma factor (sigma-70 family)